MECRRAAIVGGTEDAEYVALASSQRGAIALLNLDDGGSCTAVVVAPGKALTARHCVPSTSTTLALSFESSGGGTRVVDAAAERHPELDLAVLTWAAEGALLDAVRPIGVDLDYPSDEGELVQLAGYGVTEQGALGFLRFAAELIVESSAESFRVSGDHRAGACFGDSGGPALSRASDGSVRVVGILSQGAASCAQTDEYTRLNAVGDWLAARGIEPGPADVLADCEYVSGEGRCFGDSVLNCRGDTAYAERCRDGTRCGFNAAQGAFACVSPAADSCDGVTDLGTCEGDERLRCEGGSVVSAECSMCGATCQISVRDGRAICSG